jgi:phosphonate transport system substrate-binding protein
MVHAVGDKAITYRRKKVKYAWMVLLFFLVFPACGEDEPVVRVDLKKTEQVILKEEAGVITYAYLPQYSHTISHSRHHALIQYLRKETGLNIRQIFPDTFDQHMRMVGQKKIDISYSNPFIYVKIAHRYGAKAFARIVEMTGKESFRGQVICRADNKAIQTLADCRGKSWIAVDPASAGGYLYPLGLFISHGLNKTHFRELSFAPGPGGKQEKVVFSVYAGKYDIGTIREGTLDVVSNRIDTTQIKIISTTDPYPGWVYAARKNLDAKKVEKLKQALGKLDFNNEQHREILEAANFNKVIDSSDSDFDSVRQLAARVGISLED